MEIKCDLCSGVHFGVLQFNPFPPSSTNIKVCNALRLILLKFGKYSVISIVPFTWLSHTKNSQLFVTVLPNDIFLIWNNIMCSFTL